MFCESCGKENADGKKFCTNCGVALSSIQTEKEKKETPKVATPITKNENLLKIDKNNYKLLALLAVLLIAFFGIPKYQSYKAEKAKAIIVQQQKEKQDQDLLTAQQKALNDTKQQIIDLKNQNQTEQDARNASDLAAQQKLSDLQQSISQSGGGSDYSKIVTEWENRVAEVSCEWDKTDGTVSETDSGSALLWNYPSGGLTAITNKHVIIDSNGYAPDKCVIGVYGIGARTVQFQTGDLNPFYTLRSGVDGAYIQIDNKYLIQSSDNGGFDTSVKTAVKYCRDNIAEIGDKLIILGYPSIGTQGGITVTDGIVSGLEGDYYVTSAKIEHGNSGGAAILIKDDCYLGIPTWAESGTTESLGRILKATFFFGS